MSLLRTLLKVFLLRLVGAQAATYSGRVGRDYVSEVNSHFLSFTVDPKYLFSGSEEYGSSQECICMAASLSPAYLRIAGPSTPHMSFHNSTITIDPELKDNYLINSLINPRKRPAYSGTNPVNRNTRPINSEDATDIEEHSRQLQSLPRHKRRLIEKVEVSSDEWKRFSSWAKAMGFEIVFALNNEDKSGSGLWDPNTALNILSVAEKEGVEKIYWQLGYECTNQSIDEYLNDLETLRVIVDTFAKARAGWKVVGADVTNCLREDSKSDFKDYVALSLEMTDALMLDGNSSTHELERLTPTERSQLLRTLHTSSAPLWLTANHDHRLALSGLERAAAWMASLGHAARRGAQVHFRELTEMELYKPSLSFYMALLFKNLVGERVLTVDIESPHTVLFAHCTSLRQKPIPGAVTLFGANLDDETARLSLKLSDREDGGDIMQFILSEDESGNIVVNGHEMSQEGDIRPVVRRVRPYKTLLLNLPARSFGFWVIASTKIEACQQLDENNIKLVKAETVEEGVKGDKNDARNKRSLEDNEIDNSNVSQKRDYVDEFDVIKTGNEKFDKMLESINSSLRKLHNVIMKKSEPKVKRQTTDDGQRVIKIKRQLMKIRKDLLRNDKENKPLLNFIGNLLQFARNGTRYVSGNMLRQNLKHRNNIVKRHNHKEVGHNVKHLEKRRNINQIVGSEQTGGNKRLSRTRRDLNDTLDRSYNENEEFDINNEIGKMTDAEALAKIDEIIKTDKSVYEKYKENIDEKHENDEDVINNEIEDLNDTKKLWEVLHNIQGQLKKISQDNSVQKQKITEDDSKSKEIGNIVVKTEITDDGATVNFKEQPNTGWVKSTLESMFSSLIGLNENLNRFIETFSLFN